MSIRNETWKIENKDGLALFVQQWIPDGANPKGAVLICHGFAEHSGRYDWAARQLANSGWAVYAYDQRGHGQSQGKRGFILKFSEYTDDLGLMIDAVCKRAGVDRLTLFAHSMGGLVAATRMIETTAGVKAVAYSSPFFRVKAHVPAWKSAMAGLMSKIAPGLAMANEIDPGLISRDPADVREYASDPLIFKIARPRWYTECLAAQQQIPRRIRDIEIPQAFFISGADGLADAKVAMSIAGAVPEKTRFLKLYSEAHHESLHDLCKEEVVGDILNWLEKVNGNAK